MSKSALKEDANLLNEKYTQNLSQDVNKASSKYPYGVFFIVGNEFCERFSYYGMRAILVLYFTDWLGFTSSTATAVFHFFVALCYFSPLLGAVIADGFWGKYKTILYISIIYCIGNALMSLTAFPPPHMAGPFIALILIGLGTGGIKPCVCAFGGDQFTSGQEKWLDQFFSVFYFAVNLGSLISMIVTPLIRQNVHCFGTNCFPLAFGIPALLMFISLVLFISGRSRYKIYPTTSNVIGQMLMAIGRAVRNRCQSDEVKPHWLDYADDVYDATFLDDVRSALRVFVMFLPLPLFWALYDQQGSRWILQARQMDLTLGDWYVPPDLIPVINPILLIMLIPLFESCLYPMLEKCHLLIKPLQRMVLGMSLAVVAFILAGVLQHYIDKSVSMKFALKSNEASIRYINGAPCPVQIHTPWKTDSLHVAHATEADIVKQGHYDVWFHATESYGQLCTALAKGQIARTDIKLSSNKAYYIALSGHEGRLRSQLFEYPVKNPKSSMAFVGFTYLSDLPLAVLPNASGSLWLHSTSNTKHDVSFDVVAFSQSAYKDVYPDSYEIKVALETDNNSLKTVLLDEQLKVESGGIYTVVLQSNVSDINKLIMITYEDFSPNEISVLWQIPQYVVITIGEILFSISGLSFAYSQAPASMKSVLQAAWLLTVAGGNIIDVFVAGFQLLPTQMAEFFFFAALMSVVTVVFAVMAVFYKYKKHERAFELGEDKDGDMIIASDELRDQPVRGRSPPTVVNRSAL